MQNIKTFIIEKLKIAPRNGIKTTVAKFVGWYKGIQWFRVNRYDIEEMPFSKTLQSEFGSAHNAAEFLYKHLNDEIIVDETLSVELNRHCKLYEYRFDLDGKEFIFDARIYDESELLSNSTEYIEEKLKISKNLINNVKEIRCELRNFVTWYMYNDDEWDESDLQTVEFARNTTESCFDGSYKKLYEFICKHEQDIINVREYADTPDNYYAYEFTVEDITFKVLAYIDKPSELFSNQTEYILEKLKVSSSPVNNFKFECKVKDFFLWYWNYEMTDDDFWDAMYEIEFPNNVIEDVFDGSTNEFVNWLEPRLDDIMYFNEKIVNRAVIQYDFLIDDIEFKLWSYSDDSNMNRFSKSKFVK